MRVKMTNAFRALAVILAASVGPAMAVGSGAQAQSAAEDTVLTVYKSPYCGCCGKWVDYMRGHGFDVAVQDLEDLSAIKAMVGVPAEMQSCHTAVIGSYVIEGHVPVEAVRHLLDGDVDVQGLAVPGMPVGSPGMEGSPPQSYAVYSFTASGAFEPFMSVPAQ